MRKIKFINGGYYHIYNRGVEKRNVFLLTGDYQRFVDYLGVFNNTKRLNRHFFAEAKPRRDDELVKVVAFCLMPNHFHLLLKQEKNDGISKYLHKILTGYTMYFNKRYERSGVLFQGVFKGKYIKDDSYLLHLSRYIHLNPLEILDLDCANKETINKLLIKYPWSSYKNFVDVKCNNDIHCENEIILDQCGGKSGYKEFVIDELPRRSLGRELDMMFGLENTKK